MIEVEIKVLHDNARRLYVTVEGGRMVIETLLQDGRHAAIINFLKKAAALLPDNLHTRRFGISIVDRGDVEERMYAFSTKKEDVAWYFPCHWFDNLYGRDHKEVMAAIVEKAKTPPIHNQAFWIGTMATHPSRIEMYNLGWRKGRGTCDFRGTGPDGAEWVPIEDFSQWSVLIDIQGWGYSGRLPFLLASGRPVIAVDRTFEQAWYFNELKPWVHYIPAKEDLSNFIPTVKAVLENRDKALKIAQAGQAFALERLTQDRMVDRVVEIIYHEAGRGTHQENPSHGDGTPAQSQHQPAGPA